MVESATRDSATLLVRLAEPDRDAAAVAAIYRPVVEETTISFEELAPKEREMAERIRATIPRLPWLVAERDGELVGYAYAASHRERAAYRWSVDISVYVAAGSRRKGVGRRLYAELLSVLRSQGYVNVHAGVTLPNEASEALHREIGMTRIGVYRRVGFKLGAWHDVAWYGMRLAEPDGTPAEPRSLAELSMAAAPTGAVA